VIDTDALAPGWRPQVDAWSASAQGAALLAFLRERDAIGARIFPPRPLRALELTPFASVRVVIVGQDPYHGPGQAHGLAFSVPAGVREPPSLRNIHAELEREFGTKPRSGDLEPWSRQGVLLLNAVLTVEEGRPGIHAQRGWEVLTSALLNSLGLDSRPKVFMLWGAHAQRSRALFAGGPHLVLTANHPSPLSARRPPHPFIGCGHFGRANAFLEGSGERAIDWVGATRGVSSDLAEPGLA
jgi:uracil-DNA glycosylase